MASAQTIGRGLLAASLLLPPLGALALNIRLFGRPGAQALLIPFFAWTPMALAGFMSFQMGAGLALLSVALEPAFGRNRTSLALGRIACGVLIYLAHPLDLIFYAVLLAVTTFAASAGDPPATARQRALRALSAAATTLVSAAMVCVVTRTPPGNTEHAVPTPGYHWHGPVTSIASIVSPLRTYDWRVDAILAAVAAGALALAAARGRVSVHVGLIWTAAVFALLSPFMPYATPSGDWADRRLPLLALFTALGALRVEPAKRSEALALVGVAALLVSLRTGYIAYNFAGAERLSNAVDQALSAAPEGAVILPMQHEPTEAEKAARLPGRFLGGKLPTYWFLGSSVVWLKGGFTPTLFAQRGVHPLRVSPQWRDAAYAEGGYLPSINALTNPQLMAKYPPYVRLWRDRFDYVLVMNADFPDRNGPVQLPPELSLVNDAGFAQLYRVTHRQSAAPPKAAP